MSEHNKQRIQIPVDKLVDALLHAKQCEQHYVTQSSVDNLKEQMNVKFEQVNDKFELLEQRFVQIDHCFVQFEQRVDEFKADSKQQFNE